MPQPDSDPARERRPGSAARAAPEGTASWIRDHLDAVYRYARRRLNHDEAEDVAQQAFEALVRARAAGRDVQDAGAYLLGTARRRVAEVLRRRARRPAPVPLPDGWEGFGREALPAAVLEDRELRELVHVALGLLPRPQARLLAARYREGVSTAELAERLDVTPKAVELRLRRARQAFLERFVEVGRDWLEDSGTPPGGGETLP